MGTPTGVAGTWRCWGSREVSAPGPGAAGGVEVCLPLLFTQVGKEGAEKILQLPVLRG